MKRNDNKKQMIDLANYYNENGKKALYVFLKEEYGLKNPSAFFKKMKNNTELGYSEDIDKFTFNENHESDLFMSIEELCAPVKTVHEVHRNHEIDKSVEMEKLIHELIGDRLLELNRYITINSLSKTIIIDQTSLSSDGYQIICH